MTLPPRGDPERLEAMARNVAMGLDPLHGDDGTAVAYPDPPSDYRAVPRRADSALTGITDDPHLRYFGKYWGWWTKGPGPRRKQKQPAFRRDRTPKVLKYHGDKGKLRD